MTELRVVEGSDGIDHVFTIKQRGSNSAEDLSSFSTATMIVKSRDLQDTIATITLTNTDLTNGILTYTTDTTDGFPAVTNGTEKKYKAQIIFTGSGFKDATDLFDFVVFNNIT